MPEWLDIVAYREFSDVPRIFLVRYKLSLYLFDCRFSDSLDDYPEHFEVYLMPAESKEVPSGDWTFLARLAVKHLGSVSVRELSFDSTRRRQLAADAFQRIREA